MATAQRAYIAAQAAIIPLLLLNWALVARHAPRFAALLRPLALAAPQLLELCVVLMVPSYTLVVAMVLLAGHRREAWSNAVAAGIRVGENVLVGAAPSAAARGRAHVLESSPHASTCCVQSAQALSRRCLCVSGAGRRSMRVCMRRE